MNNFKSGEFFSKRTNPTYSVELLERRVAGGFSGSLFGFSWMAKTSTGQTITVTEKELKDDYEVWERN